jgi:hypothetical protein
MHSSIAATSTATSSCFMGLGDAGIIHKVKGKHMGKIMV